MIKRMVTGAALVLAMLGLALLPTRWFGLALAGACIFSLYEWNRLTAKSLPGFLGGAVVIAALAWFGVEKSGWLPYLCVAAAAYWACQGLDLYRNGLSRNLGPVAGLIEGTLLLMGFWAAMVWFHLSGPISLIAAMAGVWAADSGAYFVGKAFGQTLLAPALSPNKTREGLIGGLIGAYLVLVGFAVYGFDPELSGRVFWCWLLAGMAAVLVSVVGDLFQSRIKRRAGVKDSGNILPGHGGVLDRIDGLMAAMPMFASLWMLAP